MRVPLSAAAFMILVGLIASQQVLATLGRVQDARIQEVAELHIQALSVALGPHVLRDDIWEIYDTLDRAASESDTRRSVFTAVADEDGRVLAASDPRRAPIDSALADQAAGAVAAGDVSIAGRYGDLRLRAPLVYQGREVGRIVTELDISDILSERRRAVVLLLLGNAAVTLGLATIGYLTMRRMLVPITRLAQRMADTAPAPGPLPDGDVPPGDTELSRLMRSYNAMADAVGQKAEAERRLAERERFVSLGRLSSSLAHEINNPLGGLLNATDTIRAYADNPDAVRQSADLLSRGLEHLRDVVQATLDQNRLDRSGAPLSPEDFEDLHLLIGPEIRRLTQTLSWQITAPHAALSPFAAAPVRQVALNLLLNASAAAGIGGRLGLAVTATDDGLSLVITDDGPGLSDHARQRLLGAGPVPVGGGVGLRLVRDLVAELHGTITAKRQAAHTHIAIHIPPPQSESRPC